MRTVLAAVLALAIVPACKDNKPAVSPGAADAAPLAEKPAKIATPDAGAAVAQHPPDAAPALAAVTPDGGGTAGKADDADATAAAPPPPPGEPIGVPPCDEYLDKMGKCIAKLSPEAQETMRAAMEDSRRAWRETAGTPEGKAALATACKQALDAAKSAAQAMGCEW